jgi:hypothetical protein
METDELSARINKHEVKKRQEQLEWMLGKIKDKMSEIGKYLQEIRDKKLYDPKYKSFEELCRAEFGFGNKRANQIIAGDNLRTLLSGIPEVAEVAATMKEAHLREIAAVEPDNRIAVLREAIKSPHFTAASIKAAKAKVINHQEPEPQKRCPTCGHIVS